MVKANKPHRAIDKLRTRQVAEMHNVSTSTVTRWVREGVIDADAVSRTPGGQIRIQRWGAEVLT